MPNDDVKRIAAGLTKAQRERVLTAPHDDWFCISWEGWKGLIWDLQVLGITAPREPGAQVLTPLGSAVRAALKEDTPDAN